MAEDAVIGSLKILLGADMSGLVEGIAKSKEALGEFREEEEITGASLKTLGVALTGVAAVFLSEFVKSGFEAINSQYELAEKLGTTTESVQVLDRAAQMTGASAEALNASASRLTATLGTVQTKGAGPAYDALQRLGLSAKTLSEMNLDKQFQTIAQRMDELGLSTSQEAGFIKDLGLRGTATVGIFRDGGQVIGEAREQLEKFGVAVSEVDARNIHNATEAFETLGLSVQGIQTQIVSGLAPAVYGIATGFGDLKGVTIDWRTISQDAILSVVTDVAQFEDAIQQVKTGFEGLIVLFHGFPALADKVFGDGQGAFKDWTEAEDQFAADMAKPLPSDAINKWVSDVKAGTAAVGDAAANARAELDKMFGGADTGPTDQSKTDNKAAQDKLDQQLKSLQNSLQATIQSEDEAYDDRIAKLNEFLAKKMITQQQYDDLFTREQQDHANKLRAIEQQSFQQQTQDQFATLNQISSTLDAIGSAIQSSGDDHFNIAKGFSVATALLKGYESITSSYAAGAAIGGPLVGAAFAALAAAATAAQIAQIMSTTSSSSGSPSGTAAGTAATSPGATTTTQAQQGTTLTLNGISPDMMYSGTVVRGLAQQLIQFQKDGGTLVVMK